MNSAAATDGGGQGGPSPPSPGSSSTGIVVGIVVVVLVGAGAGTAYFLYKRKIATNRNNEFENLSKSAMDETPMMAVPPPDATAATTTDQTKSKLADFDL